VRKKLTPLNIKDPEVYQMARKLADLTGQSGWRERNVGS